LAIAGPKNKTGPQGEQGIQGNPGADANEWLTGEGEPNKDHGNTRDLFLDTDTGDIYKKQKPTLWLLIGNIRGPRGKKGKDGEDGKDGKAGRNGSSFGLIRSGEAPKKKVDFGPLCRVNCGFFADLDLDFFDGMGCCPLPQGDAFDKYLDLGEFNGICA